MSDKNNTNIHKFFENISEAGFSGWRGIFLLIFISALTFLPHVRELTYYRDDWYYIVDGFTGGANIFHTMFAIDRPARGYIFEWLFQLFGTQPLPYHLSTYFWRLLSGFAAWWLFRQLWHTQKQATFWMGLLFVLYPGYLWWVSGVEYQPMIMSVFFQCLSIALTIVAIQPRPRAIKIIAGLAAILTGWVYIFLVDYAAGMEAMRFLCIYVYILHTNEGMPLMKRMLTVLRKGWVFLIIPIGYLTWNLFLFQNQRSETDILSHINSLFSRPLYMSFNWLVNLFQSVANTAFFSWFVPFSQSFFTLRLKSMLPGVLIGILVLVCLSVLCFIFKAGKKPQPVTDASLPEKAICWQFEAFWIGLLGTVFGALPVVIANRTITFDAYSHYTLPASLSASIMIIGLVYMLRRPFIQRSMLLGLVFLAVLTHYSISVKALAEEQIVQKFWWQVSWRTSSMKPGTTLLANFADVYQGEDDDMVWGPANLIFAPHRDSSIPINYPITAIPQNYETTKKILSGGGTDWNYRSHAGVIDYGKLLILSQPTSTSCVHIMDGRWPRLTMSDSDQTLILGKFSNIDSLILEGEQPQPMQDIFGEEPAHEWCYTYQKAEAALQQGNWDEIIRLEEEAEARDLRPNDRVEWMPFLQAAAYLGDEERMTGYSTIIYEDRFLRLNACQTLRAMDASTFPLTPDNRALSEELFCD
jgi:hypothetical protein